MTFSLGLAVFFGILAGLCASMQGPLTSSISQRIGVLPATLLIHVAGALVAGLALLVARQGQSAPLGPQMAKILFAGAFGVGVLGSVAISVGRLGVTAALTLMIAAQMSAALIIDRFGLLDQPVREITWARLAGVLLLAIGAYLVVRR